MAGLARKERARPNKQRCLRTNAEARSLLCTLPRFPPLSTHPRRPPRPARTANTALLDAARLPADTTALQPIPPLPMRCCPTPASPRLRLLMHCDVRWQFPQPSSVPPAWWPVHLAPAMHQCLGLAREAFNRRLYGGTCLSHLNNT